MKANNFMNPVLLKIDTMKGDDVLNSKIIRCETAMIASSTPSKSIISFVVKFKNRVEFKTLTVLDASIVVGIVGLNIFCKSHDIHDDETTSIEDLMSSKNG